LTNKVILQNLHELNQSSQSKNPDCLNTPKNNINSRGNYTQSGQLKQNVGLGLKQANYIPAYFLNPCPVLWLLAGMYFTELLQNLAYTKPFYIFLIINL
jgi:hypothetical protein